LYDVLSGFPTDTWPWLLHTMDIVCNGTGNTATLHMLMGKPTFPSMFDEHCASLLHKAFDEALKYATEGIFKTHTRTPKVLAGIARPLEYHMVKDAFITKHAPQFMAAINTQYKDTWNVTLPQANKLLCTLYHHACDHEEPDGTLTLWLALHVPTLHRDHLASPLVPLL